MAHTVELDGAAGKSQDVTQEAAIETRGLVAALLLGESTVLISHRFQSVHSHDDLIKVAAVPSPQGTSRMETSGLQWEWPRPSGCCCSTLHLRRSANTS